MFKKIVAVFVLAAVLFSFAACGENTELFAAGAPLQAEAVGSVIAKEVAAKYEMKTICTYAGKDYKTFEYKEKKVLARVETSGNIRVLFEYPLDTEIVYNLEATKRSGNYIYFTKRDKDAAYASLCAIYIPTATQVMLVDTPCSDMVLLDTKSTSEMYAYGIIACRNQLAVIDLGQGKISSEYSKTPEEIRAFIDVGDNFFALGNFGSYTETTVEAVDKDHVMVNIIEKNKKGETKSEINFTFNPSNGVASF